MIIINALVFERRDPLPSSHNVRIVYRESRRTGSRMNDRDRDCPFDVAVVSVRLPRRFPRR